MWRFFGLLFSGCWHKWKIVNEKEYRNDFVGDSGVTYILKCESCGKLKFQTTVTEVHL